MACYRPLKGYRANAVNPTGKRSIVFKPPEGYTDFPINLPCGQCIGCRLERSRQWAIRCVHEASLYEDNCFITLTYNDESLPDGYSLKLEDFQLFMKRLRKRFGPGIRFFHCGEYGEKFGRPHYHACLFNFDFKDKELWNTRESIPLYTSKALEELWPHGFSTIGEVSFDSAAYVARYITKKITGPLAEDHYAYTNPETGEVTTRKSEYTTMSRRPGIGRGWYDKWSGDVFPSDEIIMKGRAMRPPKFYSNIYEHENPVDFRAVKSQRRVNRKKLVEISEDRLAVQEKCHEIAAKRLIRGYENETSDVRNI